MIALMLFLTNVTKTFNCQLWTYGQKYHSIRWSLTNINCRFYLHEKEKLVCILYLCDKKNDKRT